MKVVISICSHLYFLLDALFARVPLLQQLKQTKQQHETKELKVNRTCICGAGEDEVEANGVQVGCKAACRYAKRFEGYS